MPRPHVFWVGCTQIHLFLVHRCPLNTDVSRGMLGFAQEMTHDEFKHCDVEFEVAWHLELELDLKPSMVTTAGWNVWICNIWLVQSRQLCTEMSMSIH